MRRWVVDRWKDVAWSACRSTACSECHGRKLLCITGRTNGLIPVDAFGALLCQLEPGCRCRPPQFLQHDCCGDDRTGRGSRKLVRLVHPRDVNHSHIWSSSKPLLVTGPYVASSCPTRCGAILRCISPSPPGLGTQRPGVSIHVYTTACIPRPVFRTLAKYLEGECRCQCRKLSAALIGHEVTVHPREHRCHVRSPLRSTTWSRYV